MEGVNWVTLVLGVMNNATQAGGRCQQGRWRWHSRGRAIEQRKRPVQILPTEHRMERRASMSPGNDKVEERLGRERKTIVKSHGAPLPFRALIVYAYSSAASAVTSARLTYRIVFVSSVRATTDPVFIIGRMEG